MEGKALIAKLAQRKGLKAKAKEYMLSAGRCTRAISQFIKDKGAYNTDFLIDSAVDVQITIDQLRAYDPVFFDSLYEQKIKQMLVGTYKLDRAKQ